jgi:hypothetical protein
MADNKLIELAKLIYEKTKAGEITWEKTAYQGGFQTSFPKYSVIIRKLPVGLGAPTILLLDDKGEVIEELAYNPVVETPEGAVRLLDELFDLARRRAMGVDQALDELLRELQKPREKKSSG